MTNQDVAPKVYTRLKTALRIRKDVGDDGFLVLHRAEKGIDASVKGTKIKTNLRNVFDAKATNKIVFDGIVSKALDYSARGIDFYMVACGSAASGKTHTIFGTNSEPGLVQLFVHGLNERFTLEKDGNDVKVAFSFFGLHKHIIFDLLSNNRKAVTLRTPNGEEPLTKVKEYAIKSVADFQELFNHGSHRLASFVAEFGKSDAPHNLVACVTVRRACQINGKRVHYISRNCFFDLVRSSNSASAGDIDLVSLRNVAHKLSLGNLANYRLCALTRFLEPCLSGHALTYFLGTINPSKERETSDTLNLLRLVSKIKVSPICHEHDGDFEYPEPFTPSHDESGANACILKAPVAPCLVEVFSDYSLSYWYSLESEAIVKFLDKTALFSATSHLSRADIKVLFGIVEVNTKGVKVNENIDAFHMDLIVYNGTRFFLPLLSDNFKPTDLQRDIVFNRYLLAISKKAKTELNNQLKVETDTAFKDFKKTLNGEKEQMVKEMKSLQDELNEVKDAGDRKEIMTTMAELTETMEHHADVQESVALAIKNAKNDYLPIHENVGDKELVMIRGLVQNINLVLERSGCQKFRFTTNILNDSSELGVRVVNRDSDRFASMSLRVFDEFYSKFVFLQRLDMENTVFNARFIMEVSTLDLIWNRTTEPGISTVLTNIVKDSVNQTATRRMSSVCEMQSRFNKRKSIIAKISMNTFSEVVANENADDTSEPFLKDVSRYLDKPIKLLRYMDPFELLLEGLISLNSQLSLFRIDFSNNVDSVQKRALVFVSVARFEAQIELVDSRLQFFDEFYQKKTTQQNLCIAFDELNSLQKNFRTWMRNHDSFFTSDENAAATMRIKFSNIVKNIGFFLFYVGKTLPQSSKFNVLKADFNEGLLLSASTVVENIDVPSKMSEIKSITIVKRILAAGAVRELYKYIGAQNNFQTEYFSEVFAPAVTLYENTYLKKGKIDAAHYIVFLNRVQNNFKDIVGPNTVTVLQEVISRLQQIEKC